MLLPKQKKCVELMSQDELTQKQIAEQLHVSETTISKWKTDNEFNSERKLSANVALLDALPRVIRELIALVGSENEKVKLAAIKTYFDVLGILESIANGEKAFSNADIDTVIRFVKAVDKKGAEENE